MSANRRGFLETVRSFPAPVWVVFIGTFVNRFGTFVGVFLVLYLTHAGYTIPQAGLAVAAFGAGGIAAAGLGGYLADRVGRRETLVYSSVASAAATMALAYVHGLPLVVVLSFLVGTFSNMFRPPAGAILADIVPPEDRVVALGVMRFFINAGFAVGPGVAGLLADRSFVLGFGFDAGTSLAFAVISQAFLPAGAPHAERREERGAGMRAIARDHAFVLFLVASFLASAAYLQSSSTLPLWVHANGYPNSVFGALVSLNGVVIIAAELLIISVTRRMRVLPTVAAGYILVGIGFGLTGFAHTIPLLAVTVLIWSLGEMIGTPMAAAHVANAAPATLRGRYNGAWALTWSLGLVVGSIGGTWLFAHDPRILWLACFVAGAFAAGLVLVSPRKRGESSSPRASLRDDAQSGAPSP